VKELEKLSICYLTTELRRTLIKNDKFKQGCLV